VRSLSIPDNLTPASIIPPSVNSENEAPMPEFQRLVEEDGVQGAWDLLKRQGIPDSRTPDSFSSGHEFWGEEMEALVQKALKRRFVVSGRPRRTPEEEAEELRRDRRSLEAVRQIRELTRKASWLPDAQKEKAIRSFDEAERAIERLLSSGLGD